MIQRPPRSTRTDTLFPYTTRCRSNGRAADNLPVADLVPKAWNDRVQPVPARFVGRIGKIIEQVRACDGRDRNAGRRSEEHTSELQSLMRISYAVSCLSETT